MQALRRKVPERNQVVGIRLIPILRADLDRLIDSHLECDDPEQADAATVTLKDLPPSVPPAARVATAPPRRVPGSGTPRGVITLSSIPGDEKNDHWQVYEAQGEHPEAHGLRGHAA